MAYCPECKGEISETSKDCPHCGKTVIRGDELQDIPTKTSLWQKVVIAVSIIILIAIGLTFQGAEEREDRAAQEKFQAPAIQMVNAYASHTGLIREFGQPACRLEAKTHGANLYVDFPAGPIQRRRVNVFAQAVCVGLARTYLHMGYAPRDIEVYVSSKLPGGKTLHYGKAVYNGNIETLNWDPAGKPAPFQE